MLGRVPFDRVDLVAASGHFSEVVVLGEELHDPDLITSGMVYQGSLLRKRGRFEAASRHLEIASTPTKGMYYVHCSTVYADSGQEAPLLQCIDRAFELASGQSESLAGLVSDFSLDDVLWARAGGFAEL